MVVDSLIYTVSSGSSSTSTNTTSLVMQTSQTSGTPFRSVRERIVDHILQLKLSSAKILSGHWVMGRKILPLRILDCLKH